MRSFFMALMLTAALSAPVGAQTDSPAKPTIVLVHGAFAGSSSWNPVVTSLTHDGFPVVAAAVPLRSLQADSDYVASLVSSIPGPVILVGHSYGGEVISVAAAGRPNVKALVFVSGLATDIGESAASLGTRFPMGMLSSALAPPVPLTDGSRDLYILQARYWQQFAADLPEEQAVQMAATQRPIVQSALAEPAKAEAWRRLPSWFVWGQLDRNIPANLHAYLAKRAKAREAVEIPGGSHVVMLSHPDVVTGIIERAARAFGKAAADAGPSDVFNAANKASAVRPHTSASIPRIRNTTNGQRT
jgi:pimeloyl-ACP methyl ester carboxylesterase